MKTALVGVAAAEGRPRRCMRPWMRSNGSGPPAASTATISPSSTTGPGSPAASAASPPATSGNCAVFSLPRRDQIRTCGSSAPGPRRPPGAGETSTRARMPSYFRSKTRSPRPSSRSWADSSTETASIGRSAAVSARHDGPRSAAARGARRRARPAGTPSDPVRSPIGRPGYPPAARNRRAGADPAPSRRSILCLAKPGATRSLPRAPQKSASVERPGFPQDWLGGRQRREAAMARKPCRRPCRLRPAIHPCPSPVPVQRGVLPRAPRADKMEAPAGGVRGAREISAWLHAPPGRATSRSVS